MMSQHIYPSISVSPGASVLSAVCRSERILSGYLALTVAGVLYHIFILDAIEFDAFMHITGSISEVSLMYIRRTAI